MEPIALMDDLGPLLDVSTDFDWVSSLYFVAKSGVLHKFQISRLITLIHLECIRFSYPAAVSTIK